MWAAYLGPKEKKIVWHNTDRDHANKAFEFPRGVMVEVPDSLARILASAPNFRIDDGTLLIDSNELASRYKSGAPVSILIIRSLGGVGDLLMITPAVRGLREKFPSAKITFAINTGYFDRTLYEILEYNEHIDEIIEASAATFDFRRNFTSWVDLSTPCARYESATAPNVDLHRSEIYCKEAGVVPSSYIPELPCTTDDESFAMEFFVRNNLINGNPVIALQPFAADARRLLSTKTFIEAISILKDFKFIVFDYFDINLKFPENTIFCIREKIRRVACIVKRCDLAVGCDSFMLQVATAVGAPLLAIFGPTNPYMRCKFTEKLRIIWHKDKCEFCPCWYGYPCLTDENFKQFNVKPPLAVDSGMTELRKRICIESITAEELAGEIVQTIKTYSSKKETIA